MPNRQCVVLDERAALVLDGDETSPTDSRAAFVRDHLHPSQEETFTCVTGSFELDVGGERRMLGPGDGVAIPARTRHGRDARLRVPAHGLPKPLLFGVLMHRYRRDIALPGVPLWLQLQFWRAWPCSAAFAATGSTASCGGRDA